MNHYRLFGGTLSSDIEFPGLRETDADVADWSLLRATTPVAAASGRLLGSESVTHGVEVRLWTTDSGYRLDYDDTGTFTIDRAGSDIHWTPGHAGLETVRIDVTGRVLACALHASGVLTLHASAVVFDGRAVAFLAPKGFGKSTLALAAVLSGATVLTDDTLPVEVTEAAVLARPGLGQLRVRGDVSSRLLGPDPAADDGGAARKRVVRAPERGWSEDRAVPLDALYVLSPVDPRTARRARRLRMPTVEAALILTSSAKLGGLLGGSEAGDVLDRSSDLARRVPVYALEVPRTLDALESVTADVAAWTRGAT